MKKIVFVGIFIAIAMSGCSVDYIGDSKNGVLMAPGPSSATIYLYDDKDSTYSVSASHSGNTWCYSVTKVKGRDISHITISIGCPGHVLSYSPPPTEVNGGTAKWEGISPDSFSFCITMDDNYVENSVTVSVKAGTSTGSASILGPSCEKVQHDQGTGS